MMSAETGGRPNLSGFLAFLACVWIAARIFTGGPGDHEALAILLTLILAVIVDRVRKL
jgi:hypothetical protein